MSIKKSSRILEILLFGTFWGLIEAFLGGLLHFIHFTAAGALMSAVAMGLLSTYVLVYKREKDIPLIGAVSAAVKCSGIFLFPMMPVMDTVRPATAILLESFVFFSMFLIFSKILKKETFQTIASVAAGSYLWFFVYGIMGYFIFKKGIGRVRDIGELAIYILNNATITCAFSIVLAIMLMFAVKRLNTAGRLLPAAGRNYRTVLICLSVFFFLASISVEKFLFA